MADSQYLDLPFKIDPLTHQMKTCQLQTAIRHEVLAVLSTQLKERPMCPTFGCRLKDYLFEGIQEETLAMMEREVIASLHRWIPAIHDLTVRFEVQQEILQVYVEYQISSLHLRDEVLLPLPMESL